MADHNTHRKTTQAAHAAPSGKNTKKKKKARGGRWWKILLIVAGALAVVMIGLFLAVYFFLGQAAIDPFKKETTYGGQDILEHNLPAIDETDGSHTDALPTLAPLSDEHTEGDSADGEQNPDRPLGELLQDGTTVQQLMRNWCANGQPVSSDQVMNILLIGMDNDNIAYNSRADSLILFSVNTKTKAVTMASILRDHYAYIQSGNGESFEKMHLANVRGGPQLMISTIEAHYKVQIDNYVMVSLSTFPQIIDRLGGVDLTLTQAEADALGLSAGAQHLNGNQALRFSRLRSIDSEQNRTGRQRQVLTALMSQLRNASLTELLGVINDLLPCVRTGFTQTQMIGLATRAVSEGWLGYSVQQFYTPSGADWQGRTLDDGLWYWLVDYPSAAYTLQMKLYGRSNITLSPNRRSFLDYPVS